MPWRPGARELLADLRTAGVPCALVTMSWTALAQVLATGIGLVWNFAGSRWWAFKPASAPGK